MANHPHSTSSSFQHLREATSSNEPFMDAFSDDEKRFVLAELVKVNQLDVGNLIRFLKDNGVILDQRCLDIQVPRGRNLRQCINAAQAMFDQPQQTPLLVFGEHIQQTPTPIVNPSAKRRSLSDISVPEQSFKKQAVSSTGTMSPRPRPLSASQIPPLGTQHQNIQPRPPNNGWAPPPSAAVRTGITVPPTTTRPRGRPKKAERDNWLISMPTPNSPQPQSPSLRGQPPPQPAPQVPLEQAVKRKPLFAEIAPKPAQGESGYELASRPQAAPGPEYQSSREDILRREYYPHQSSEQAPRDPPMPSHTPISPRPPSPYPQLLPRMQSSPPELTEPPQPRDIHPAIGPPTARGGGSAPVNPK